MERIRLAGPIWKPALAVGLSWIFALPTGTHRPYFAPLAAILSMQVTVEESLWRGYQRVSGIVGGIVIADAVTRYVGIHVWSLALLVFVGTALATWLKLGSQAIPQVGVSAIMVMVLGTGHQDYALDRIADTIIGVITAVLVNMLVVPPDFTAKAESAVAQTASQFAQHLRMEAERVAASTPTDPTHPSHPDLSDLHHAREMVETGLQALRFSPLVRHRRARLAELNSDMQQLTTAYDHLVVLDELLSICRADQTWALDQRANWAMRLTHLADVIEGWASPASRHGAAASYVNVRHPMTSADADIPLQSNYHAILLQFSQRDPR